MKYFYMLTLVCALSAQLRQESINLVELPTKCDSIKGHLLYKDPQTDDIKNVYAVISSKSFELYDSPDAQPLQEQQRAKQTFSLLQMQMEDHHDQCFTLQQYGGSAYNLLCAGSAQERDQWTNGVKDLTKCAKENEAKQEEVAEEYEEVEIAESVQGYTPAQIVEEVVEEEKQLNLGDEDVPLQISETTQQIINAFTGSRQIEKSNSDRMWEELKKAESIREEVKRKKELLEESIQADAIAKEQQLESIIRQKFYQQNSQKLQDAAQQITLNQADEAKQLLESQRQLVQRQKEIARQEISNLAKLADQYQFTNAQSCWHEDLKKGEVVMRETCQQLFADNPEDLTLCSIPEHFCQYCCEGFIPDEPSQDSCRFDRCAAAIFAQQYNK